MRKTVLLILVSLLTGSLFAQDPGAAEKNAGNVAWKAKNYTEAFANFEKYLKAVNYADEGVVGFPLSNCRICLRVRVVNRLPDNFAFCFFHNPEEV